MNLFTAVISDVNDRTGRRTEEAGRSKQLPAVRREHFGIVGSLRLRTVLVA